MDTDGAVMEGGVGLDGTVELWLEGCRSEEEDFEALETW